MLSQSGIIFTAYLAAGRVGAIAACLLLGISPWETLIVAVLIDIAQVPVYGLALETSKKYMILPKRFQRWVDKKSEKFRNLVQEKRYWKRLLRYRDFALIVVTSVPLRGFGVLSACILAATLDYGRIRASIMIMVGSVLGSLFAIWAIFFPGRYFGVL